MKQDKQDLLLTFLAHIQTVYEVMLVEVPKIIQVFLKNKKLSLIELFSDILN